MLSMNGKRLFTKVMWCDYVKSVQNLKKFAINFSYWVRDLDRPDNHIRHEVKIEWVWLYGVSNV